ncbi:MAG: nuclear transport factor 2 family protein [Deltaproteobacteria bacterium]|nr:MAG: nuclear transport factor 2 family protein [Deltaproteobacteria bacterium]TMA83098.1 MAG: nuclear transport factor 2 family protein [Deltaproteobacteria bacterium]
MATSEEAIASLVHAYAERIDAGDLEGVAGLFADATYRSARGVYEGGEAVLALLRRRVILHDGTPLTKHVITNLSIEVVETADTASARSYYTVLQATPALGLQPIVAGRYEDRFVRIRGTWRFTERFVHVDLVGDLSQHVRGGFT